MVSFTCQHGFIYDADTLHDCCIDAGIVGLDDCRGVHCGETWHFEGVCLNCGNDKSKEAPKKDLPQVRCCPTCYPIMKKKSQFHPRYQECRTCGNPSYVNLDWYFLTAKDGTKTDEDYITALEQTVKELAQDQA